MVCSGQTVLHIARVVVAALMAVPLLVLHHLQIPQQVQATQLVLL